MLTDRIKVSVAALIRDFEVKLSKIAIRVPSPIDINNQRYSVQLTKPIRIGEFTSAINSVELQRQIAIFHLEGCTVYFTYYDGVHQNEFYFTKPHVTFSFPEIDAMGEL